MPLTRANSFAGQTTVHRTFSVRKRAACTPTSKSKISIVKCATEGKRSSRNTQFTSPDRQKSASPRKRISPKQDESRTDCSPSKRSRSKNAAVNERTASTVRRTPRRALAEEFSNTAQCASAEKTGPLSRVLFATENIDCNADEASEGGKRPNLRVTRSTPAKKAEDVQESKTPSKRTGTKDAQGTSSTPRGSTRSSSKENISSAQKSSQKGVALTNMEDIINSPVKENLQRFTPIKSCIPAQKALSSKRMLTFSPKLVTSDPYHKAATLARSLEFNSPDKRLSGGAARHEIRALFTDADTSRVSSVSPVKPPVCPDSPAKRSIFGTPKKQNSQLNSPFKTLTKFAPRSPATRGCFTSPRRRGNTKEMAAELSSSVHDVRQSPRKTSNPYSSTLSSPRRSLLASPTSDVRQSPRKNYANRFSSPSLRLAKQESECYVAAKKALHRGPPDRLVCREKELSIVQGFLNSHVSKSRPGSMYISGVPGTGKNAVLCCALKQIEEETKCTVVWVNCVQCKNSASIFNMVLSELSGKASTLSYNNARAQLDKKLSAEGPMIVLILDEVDLLGSTEDLLTLFEWTALPTSRVILVGIGNELNLTYKKLIRLLPRPEYKPTPVPFPPYHKDQIVRILEDRLQVESESQRVVERGAITLCSGKAAAKAGGIRYALDICRRAVELVEAEVRKQQILKVTTGCNSPYKDSYKSPGKARPPAMKKVTARHIAQAVAEADGQKSLSEANQKQEIPRDEKLALCTILLMLRKGSKKTLELGKVYEMYVKVCKREHVTFVADGQFQSMCSLSEAKGFLSLKTKDQRTQVTLKLSEPEHRLQDNALITRILKRGLPS